MNRPQRDKELATLGAVPTTGKLQDEEEEGELKKGRKKDYSRDY
jgi:hypothetical protein